MDDLSLAVRNARREADWEAANARSVGQLGKAARVEVSRLREQLELHEKVLGVLTSVGEARQESVQRQVEGLVTRALQVIFEENLSFHLVPAVKANRVEIDFMLRSRYGDTEIDTPVLEARGGGMACVVGFVLHLVVLLLTPGARRIMFLDEPFGMVSAEYEPRVADFLREVADKAGMQIYMNTHSHAYDDLADMSYELSLGPDGATKCVQGGAGRLLASIIGCGHAGSFPALWSLSSSGYRVFSHRARRRTGPRILPDWQAVMADRSPQCGDKSSYRSGHACML